MHKSYGVALFFGIVLIGITGYLLLSHDVTNRSAPHYKNTSYGFRFDLPQSWEGYTIITSTWQGYASGEHGDTLSAEGPLISIRHPKWSEQAPRQDIPVMIFTLSQWNALQRDAFHIGAAPIGPRELGRNKQYVFALPARYNFSFPIGYEEVEHILESTPLHAF